MEMIQFRQNTLLRLCLMKKRGGNTNIDLPSELFRHFQAKFVSFPTLKLLYAVVCDKLFSKYCLKKSLLGGERWTVIS